MDFDAVMVLGKELRKDPARGRAELRARAAAAATAWRAGVPRVLSLEARLRGQAQAGSELVATDLHRHAVPASALILDTQTRSTREEALEAHRLCQAHGWTRLLVITAAYHLPRARRCFEEVLSGTHVMMSAPEDLLPLADDLARLDIVSAQTPEAAVRMERRAERVLSCLATALLPLPRSVRWGIEVRAGAWLRGVS